jgi:transcriptional regulator
MTLAPMFVPPAFRLDDVAACQQVLTDHPFMLLIDRGPAAELTHLPLTLVADEGEFGTLYGHVARGNQHALSIAGGHPQTVVASGPHAYISPTWYPDPAANVPTWNYVVVHAEGTPEPLADPLPVLRDLSARYESRWRPDLLAPGQLQRMAAAILAFRLPIDRLTGKAKLSQNRSAEDRAGLIAGLTLSTDSVDQTVASLMRSA